LEVLGTEHSKECIDFTIMFFFLKILNNVVEMLRPSRTISQKIGFWL